jgi:hypothetical protein
VQADLFHRWQVSPGALIPVREHGPWTMTNSNGGGYYIIWRFNNVYARGGRIMLDAIWNRVTGARGTPPAVQVSETASLDAER